MEDFDYAWVTARMAREIQEAEDRKFLEMVDDLVQREWRDKCLDCHQSLADHLANGKCYYGPGHLRKFGDALGR